MQSLTGGFVFCVIVVYIISRTFKVWDAREATFFVSGEASPLVSLSRLPCDLKDGPTVYFTLVCLPCGCP
jgi:hypothetical protein